MAISSSRTRSPGAGAAEPVASRTATRSAQRDAGPRAQLLEGLAGERGEDAVRRIIHEVEREVAALQRVGEEVERDARRLQPIGDARPAARRPSENRSVGIGL